MVGCSRRWRDGGDGGALAQFNRGGDGGVGVGVTVTVVWSTESREADRLPTRNKVTASLSGSALLEPALLPAPRLPLVLDLAAARPPRDPAAGPGCCSALLTAHCTAPPRPTITDSHFCLPLFFFLRLKKQQHLEMKQTLIGLRVVSFAASLVGRHRHAADWKESVCSVRARQVRPRRVSPGANASGDNIDVSSGSQVRDNTAVVSGTTLELSAI